MIPHRRIKQINTIACSAFFSEESTAFACILGFSDADDLVALDNVRQLYTEHEHEPLKQFNEARFAGSVAPEIYKPDGLRADGERI